MWGEVSVWGGSRSPGTPLVSTSRERHSPTSPLKKGLSGRVAGASRLAHEGPAETHNITRTKGRQPPRARGPGSTRRACAVPGSCEPGASGSVSRRRYRPDAHNQQEDYIVSGGSHKRFTPQALSYVVSHNTVPRRGRP